MSAAAAPRADFAAHALRRPAEAGRDVGQSRRLPAPAEIYDGGSRMDAARVGVVGLQTVRDGVSALDAERPAGPIDGRAPGNRPKLSAAQRRALARTVERGPDRDGVVRRRLKDPAAWIFAGFGVSPVPRPSRCSTAPDGTAHTPPSRPPLWSRTPGRSWTCTDLAVGGAVQTNATGEPIRVPVPTVDLVEETFTIEEPVLDEAGAQVIRRGLRYDDRQAFEAKRSRRPGPAGGLNPVRDRPRGDTGGALNPRSSASADPAGDDI